MKQRERRDRDGRKERERRGVVVDPTEREKWRGALVLSWQTGLTDWFAP